MWVNDEIEILLWRNKIQSFFVSLVHKNTRGVGVAAPYQKDRSPSSFSDRFHVARIVFPRWETLKLIYFEEKIFLECFDGRRATFLFFS